MIVLLMFLALIWWNRSMHRRSGNKVQVSESEIAAHAKLTLFMRQAFLLLLLTAVLLAVAYVRALAVVEAADHPTDDAWGDLYRVQFTLYLVVIL